jgi:hypothetical protein
MKEFDYDPEKDGMPSNIVTWIILLSIGLAIYLSQILV